MEDEYPLINLTKTRNEHLANEIAKHQSSSPKTTIKKAATTAQKIVIGIIISVISGIILFFILNVL